MESKADAIVNTANPALEIGGGVDAAIYKAAGKEQLLRQCYDRALALAVENGCQSIAFPVLATGTYAFLKELGIQIAIDSFTKFLEKNELEITLVVFGSELVSISGRLMDEVSSFIDDRYVQEALVKEYKEELFSNAPILAASCRKETLKYMFQPTFPNNIFQNY